MRNNSVFRYHAPFWFCDPWNHRQVSWRFRPAWTPRARLSRREGTSCRWDSTPPLRHPGSWCYYESRGSRTCARAPTDIGRSACPPTVRGTGYTWVSRSRPPWAPWWRRCEHDEAMTDCAGLTCLAPVTATRRAGCRWPTSGRPSETGRSVLAASACGCSSVRRNWSSADQSECRRTQTRPSSVWELRSGSAATAASCAAHSLRQGLPCRCWSPNRAPVMPYACADGRPSSAELELVLCPRAAHDTPTSAASTSLPHSQSATVPSWSTPWRCAPALAADLRAAANHLSRAAARTPGTWSQTRALCQDPSSYLGASASQGPMHCCKCYTSQQGTRW